MTREVGEPAGKALTTDYAGSGGVVRTEVHYDRKQTLTVWHNWSKIREGGAGVIGTWQEEEDQGGINLGIRPRRRGTLR